MANLGEYLGSGSSTTKLLLHLNNDSTDSSGNNNNGTDSNITYVDGKFGKCASFNGSSSVINVGNAGLNLTGDFTIAGWMYITSSGSSNLNILTTRGQSGSPFEQYSVFEQNGTIYCRLRNTGGSTVYDAAGTSAGINKWQSVIGVVSGTTVSIYINGVKGTDATFVGTRLNLSIDTKIGGGYVSNQQFWMNGLIDEPFTEARAWSAEEVKKYYTNSRGFYATL